VDEVFLSTHGSRGPSRRRGASSRGDTSSVRKRQGEAAQIYPVPANPRLPVSQAALLAMFDPDRLVSKA
jgi:hypothetical protein